MRITRYREDRNLYHTFLFGVAVGVLAFWLITNY